MAKTTKKLRVGVLGCGVIGQAHLRAAQKLSTCRVTMVADLREEAAKAVAETFGIPGYSGNPEDVLTNPDIDVVVLALPTAPRANLAIKAFKHGKHVLVEKPAAMNAKELQRMIKAMEANGVKGSCCSCRYGSHKSAAVARSFIKSGGLGKLRNIRCRALMKAPDTPSKNPPPWRLDKSLNGGGILVNWGVYDLDYLMTATDWQLEPSEIMASTWEISPDLKKWISPNSNAETYFTSLIRFKDGTMMNFERGEFFPMPTQAVWEITGDKGTLELFMTATKETKIIHHNTSKSKGIVTRELWSGDSLPTTEHDVPLKNLVDAIRKDKEPVTSLYDSLKVARIIDGIYKSAEKNTAVKVSG